MAIQSSLAWWLFFSLSLPTLDILGWVDCHVAWCVPTWMDFEFRLNVSLQEFLKIESLKILRAVISGFLQAQGISVPLGQMEKLLGIDTTGYFIEQVYTLFKEVIICLPDLYSE